MPATTSVSSTTDNGCISSQTHQELLNLLGKLDDEDHDWLLKQQQESKRQSTSYLTPARLYRKLYSIHDTLDQLGFAFEHMEKVVTALGRDITLESALDWLCLHLKTQDLPPLLTEGSVREQETSVSGGTATTTTSSSLTVLRPTPVVESDTASTSNHIDEKLPEEHPLPNPAIAKPPKKKETNDKSQTSSPEEKDDTKAWILQQYQYEEEEEYDEEDVLPMMTTMNTVDEQPEVEMPPSNGSNKEQMDKQQQQEHSITAKDDFVVDPNQARLQELEEQLRQQEADLKDEAANYMRSKHEIKELQASAKKLRKQVQGLQKKMKKNRAAEAEATKNDENRNGNSSDDAELGQDEGDVLGVFQEDDEGGGLFGMFDQDESVESKPRNRENKGEAETDDKEEGPPPSDPVVPKGSVPKGWSGKTPKTILEEWCRKEKIRRPQFFKLPKLNGARIRVDVTPAALTMETDNYMGSYLDAQEYLATKALYELNQDLPLYRLFPPFYRELWCSWTESAQTEKNAQKQQEHDAIKEKVERLMDCVQKPKGTDDLKEKVDFSSNSRKNGDAVAPVVADCWEDDKEADVDVLVDNRWEATDTASGDGSRNESVLDKNVSSSSSTSRSGDNLKAMFMKRQKIPQYQEMLEARSALPMYSYRDQVLGTIRNNPVTVLCAEVSKTNVLFDVGQSH